MNRRRKKLGFSLIEMMVTIVIVGLLSAIAIPSFLKYTKRARTIEGLMNIRRLYDASVAYFDTEHGDAAGTILPNQFPTSHVTTPVVSEIGNMKREPSLTEWQTPTWQALNFWISDPHYFAYQYDSMGTTNDATFTASAFGNLDDDESYSSFIRVGSVRNSLVRGGAGVYMSHPTE